MFEISEKNKYLMVNKNKLFGFKLNKDSDFVEIGGGEGDLSLNLKTQGYNLVLFVEPDIKKYEVACVKLNICGTVPTPKSTLSNPNLLAPRTLIVDSLPVVPFVNVKLLLAELEKRFSAE